MLTYPFGLEFSFLVLVFIYIHTLFLGAVNALVSLCICTDSPEPSLLADAISIEISCTGPNDLSYINFCFFRIILIS